MQAVGPEDPAITSEAIVEDVVPTALAPEEAAMLESIAQMARNRVLKDFASSEELDLVDQEWVGDWFLDVGLRTQLSSHLRSGGVVRVRDFLGESYAEDLHEELGSSSSWEVRRETRAKYQYSFRAISDHRPTAFFSPAHRTLRRLYGLLNSSVVKRWAEGLLGETPGTFDADTTVMATHYRAGDYTGLHSDAAPRRKLAFVLHLSKDWRPEFGGDLVFIDPVSIFHPEFNTLTLFKVGDGKNWHQVSPVTADARGHAARYAITGWFNSSQTPAAEPTPDDTAFVFHVDGSAPAGSWHAPA